MLRLLPLTFLMVACGGDDVELDTIAVDYGTVCINGGGRSPVIAPNEPAFVTFTGPCIGCDEVIDNQCSVSVSGATIEVSSLFTTVADSDLDCLAGCSAPDVVGCKLPALEAGVYQVRYGENAIETEVGGEGDQGRCFSDGKGMR